MECRPHNGWELMRKGGGQGSSGSRGNAPRPVDMLNERTQCGTPAQRRISSILCSPSSPSISMPRQPAATCSQWLGPLLPLPAPTATKKPWRMPANRLRYSQASPPKPWELKGICGEKDTDAACFTVHQVHYMAQHGSCPSCYRVYSLACCPHRVVQQGAVFQLTAARWARCSPQPMRQLARQPQGGWVIRPTQCAVSLGCGCCGRHAGCNAYMPRVHQHQEGDSDGRHQHLAPRDFAVALRLPRRSHRWHEGHATGGGGDSGGSGGGGRQRQRSA